MWATPSHGAWLDAGGRPGEHVQIFPEQTMAKGQQRSTKESKKPKKDSGPTKTVSPFAVTPTVTTVVPDRSKKKK